MADCEQQRQAEQREAGLAQDRQCHVCHQACRRFAAAGDMTPDDAIGDNLAADARDGQKAVDRFPDPGRPGQDAHARTLPLAQEPAPRAGVGDHRQGMEERGEKQSRTRRDDEGDDAADILAGEQRHGQGETRDRQHRSDVFHAAAKSRNPPVCAPVA